MTSDLREPRSLSDWAAWGGVAAPTLAARQQPGSERGTPSLRPAISNTGADRSTDRRRAEEEEEEEELSL